MAFKLGSRIGNKDKKLNIGGVTSDHDIIGGVRIEFAKLDEGVLGEAHKEGVIYVSDQIEYGSSQYNRVVAHEMKHMTDLEIGKVDYTDDNVFYNGVNYPRKDGYIFYDGEWQEEGSIDFPWEFKD